MDNATPIEAISLNFTSENKGALASFDEVINKLKQLQGRLPHVELKVTGGKSLKDIVTTANGLNEDGINKLSRLADALEKLSTVSIPHGIASSLRSINKAMNTTGVEGAEKAAEAISNMHDLSQTIKGTWEQSTAQSNLPTALDSIAQSGEKLTEIAPPVASLSEYFSNGSQAAYQLSSGIADITKNLFEMKSASNQIAGLLPANRMGGLLPAVSSAGRMRSDYVSEAMKSTNIQEATQQFAALGDQIGRTKVEYDKFAVAPMKMSWSDIFDTALSKAKSFFGTMRTGFADVMSYKGGDMPFAQGLVSGMTPFGSAMYKGIGLLGKGMFMPLAKELQYFGKSAMGAASSIGNFFGRFKRIAILRLMRATLKAIANGFKEGTNNLYEWSKAFDKTHEFANSMDKIATAILYVKNSLGAMVAPIINALAPALDWLADKFVGLLNIINEFFAALTGAETYTVAKKVATEFKAAADNTGKATKALKSFTIGIDELNIIEDTGSSGSGGGGNSNAVQDWFEKKTVSRDIKEFFENLKKMFEKGDWNGIGRILGTKANELVDKIPWKSIGTKAGKLFTASFTIGTSFLDTFNATGLGSKVATMINNFFEQADFSKAGEFFITALFKGVDFVGGFLDTLDWKQVTEKISDFFIGGMRKATKWFKKQDWKEVGTKLYNKIKDALSGIKLTELAGSFWDLINGVTTATIDIVVSFVDSAGKDIGNWFYDLTQGNLPDPGEKPLQFIVGGVGADIIEGLVFLAKNGYVDENLNITVKSIDQGMYNIGEKTTPLAPGLLMSPDPGGESSFGLDMWKNFLTVVEKVRNVLADIMEILGNPAGIAVQKWDAIKTGIENIGDAGADAIENMKDFFKRIDEAFGDGKELGVIGVAVSWTKKQFESDMGDIKYWLDKGGQWFKDFGGDAGVAFGAIPTAFARHWGTLSGKLRYAKAKIELESMKLWNAVKSGFKTKVNQFISILNSAIRVIYKGLNKVAKGIDKMAESGTFGMLGKGLISKIGSTFASAPQIPQLARGGVIDPNKPFLALLGDQKSGKNIEAPLETIKKALEDVIRDYDASSISMPGIADVVNVVSRYADSKMNTKSDTESMQRFYEETVMPVITAIASDAKRQADKNETTEVYMDSRKVTNSVNKQNRANGYSFIK